MAVPWGSLQAQRSRVLPQTGQVLGNLVAGAAQGFQAGRQRAAEDAAPDVLMNYLDTVAAGGQQGPMLGNLAPMPTQPTFGTPNAPPATGLTPIGDSDWGSGDVWSPGRPAGALTPQVSPAGSGVDSAVRILDQFEGFRETPYEDWSYRPGTGERYMSGMRIGYGQTMPGVGNITREQAQAALRQQIEQQYIPSIVSAIGGDRYAALTPDQQGVLISLVHNYGSLPNRIIPALQSGDPAAAAAAIAGLGGDNSGINQRRRQAEAAYFSGGGAAPSGGTPGGYRPQAPAWSPPSDQERAALRALIVNPATREYGIQAATQRMTPPAPVQSDPVVINGQLVDRNTGQVIGDYRDPQAAAGAGFRPLVDPAERAAMGIPTTDQSFYQVGPDGRVYRESGGGTNVEVNLPGQPMIGTIPPAWQATELETGGYTMAPIPGGPADREVIEAQQAREINALYAQRQSDTLLTTLGNAEEIIQRNPGQTTGWGAYLSALPASESRTLQSLLDTSRAIIGFDTLQAMRDASPTGGALGQVTERELAFLQSVQGSLDQSLSADVLLRNIQAIAASVERWNQAVQAARGQTSGGAAPATGGAAPEGTIIQLQDGTFQIKQNGQWVPYGG